MIESGTFVQQLKNEGFRFFTGVPCSFFQSAINAVVDDKSLKYVTVPNEGAALAAASGAILAGEPAVVLIQNSGFGNLINPLTSLNMIYGLGVLIFISGRAYGVADEPQHEIIGKSMAGMLDAMGVAFEDLPSEPEALRSALGRAHLWIRNEKQPFVFFVRKDTLLEYAGPSGKDVYPLKRIDAIKIIAESIGDNDYVVATTGKPSRELFKIKDRVRNFYMQGSMGHAAAIGLGAALSRPDERIIVLDGDGAILMHLGILSSIGHYRPKNFYHIVLDNEAYESTGGQDTTSASSDLCAVAHACGYVWTKETSTADELKRSLEELKGIEGPCFLRVKINRIATPDVPRISGKHSSRDIASHFSEELARGRT
ncbi:MAG: phosphonopyruvate decarboxylase [Candidatus Omnitrophota bacterium]|nr:phosphonopyruvate decarboxylase [Candidatus Omnitrophota bacterium]